VALVGKFSGDGLPNDIDLSAGAARNISMDWLSHNAGAIAALTAIATAIATITLAVITWRYVRLTKTLADAANAQILAQADAKQTKRRALATYIAVLRNALGTIPSGNVPNVHERIRNSTDWKDFDFGRFRVLAAEVSPAAGQIAAEIESKLRRLEAIVDSVREMPLSVSRLGGVRSWSPQQWAEWEEIVRRLPEALSTLSNEIERSQ
jgi:hypothetical protein